MERVKLGGIELSRLVQGFWRLTGWNMSTEELAAFMSKCVELGVTTFDTAEIYGNTECETQMGRALAKTPGLRGKVEIVSKTGITREGDFGYYDTSYKRVMESCMASIERLQCGHIDLYLIHREDPCIDPWETAKALKELKAKGLVREVGVSNFDPFKLDALNTAMDGQLVTNQIELNPLCFEHFESGMMDNLTRLRMRPMYWSPLAGGELFTGEGERSRKARALLEKLADKYGVPTATMAYAWLLYHPAGGLAISGSRDISRLEQAIMAFDVELEHGDWYRIYTASGQMKLR